MPATVNYSDVTNNGATPFLTPAATLAELQGRATTNLITGARCQVIDENTPYTWNGTAWEDEHAVVWEAIIPNTGWGSQAYIAKVNRGKFAVLRGYFTSTTDENTGSVFTFPTGYLPQNDELRAAVSSLIGGSSYVPYSGTLTWSGGQSTLAVVQPGVVDGDNLTASVNNSGTGGPPFDIRSATPKTDLGGPNAGSSGILFTLTAANTNNDVEISWAIRKIQASSTDSLRSAFGSDDVTLAKSYNTNDKVYVESVYYALDPAQ
jgi:hypothetical protein